MVMTYNLQRVFTWISIIAIKNVTVQTDGLGLFSFGQVVSQPNNRQYENVLIVLRSQTIEFHQ